MAPLPVCDIVHALSPGLSSLSSHRLQLFPDLIFTHFPPLYVALHKPTTNPKWSFHVWKC